MIYYRVILLCLSLFILPFNATAAVDDTELAVWANEAIISTYTYNYKNFLERQKKIAVYFNAKGWINYSKALIDSKLTEAVKTNNYYVSAVATMPPTIKMINKEYWEAKMPILVVYKNSQMVQKQNLEVTLQFSASPSGQGMRGLAISSLQAKQVTPSCKCPVQDPS